MTTENVFGTVDDAVITADRSTLERWANCPFQGYAIEHNLVNDCGLAADVGNECHRIISEAMGAYAKSYRGDAAPMTPAQFREQIVEAAANSRPDIQPRVIMALSRGAAFTLAETICINEYGRPRHPEDLMIFDGGAGNQSGQLSMDIPAGDTVVRVTSELDLLIGLSPGMVKEIDYKSGWKHWTGTDVGESFQFQMHAELVFENFPETEIVECRVIQTAKNSITSPAYFQSKFRAPIRKRITSAASLYVLHRNAKQEDVPAWPAPEKCGICPAARICPHASKPAANVAADPKAALQAYVVMSEATNGLEAQLKQWVLANGTDIEVDGTAFGERGPKAVPSRASTMKVYSVAGTESPVAAAKPKRKTKE